MLPQNFPHFDRYRPIVDDWSGFSQKITEHLPVCIWINSLRIQPNELIKSLRGDGIEPDRLAWTEHGLKWHSKNSPAKTWQFNAGLFQVQEEVSMLPVQFLAPQPGERVLDLCAAPGSKTVQAAIAMQNRGTVIANDINEGRLNIISQKLVRFGLLNVATTVYDAGNYPKAAGTFDRVLVDAPCSSEGTVRKNPHLLEKANDKMIISRARAQRAMLRRAVKLCKPGGRIVYSTCTFAPEENEMNVAWALENSGDALEVEEVHLPGFRCASGVTSWQGETLPSELKHAVRCWPHHNDTGGFFVAVIRKKTRASFAGKKNESAKETAVLEQTEDALKPYRVSPQKAVAEICRRFDFDASIFDKIALCRKKKTDVAFVAQSMQPTLHPKPRSMGFYGLRPTLEPAKLSTGGSLFFGAFACQNVVNLSTAQVQKYYRREVFEIEREQMKNCTGRGYVIVRFRGLTLGSGFLLQAGDGTNVRLKSLVPKAWVVEVTLV